MLSGHPDRRFNLDGAVEPLSPTNTSKAQEPWVPDTYPTVNESADAAMNAGRVTPVPPPVRRDSTLPSVLDIRHHSSVGGGTRIGPAHANSDFYDIDETTSLNFAAPVVEQSDYSLVTTDLQTPITPSRDAATAAFNVSSL